MSGAYGGKTIDFRRLAGEGITLLGLTQEYRDGVLSFAGDLNDNISKGDASYLGMLDARRRLCRANRHRAAGGARRRARASRTRTA